MVKDLTHWEGAGQQNAFVDRVDVGMSAKRHAE
jgi:hypothetical protein